MKNKIFREDKIFIAGASGMVGSAIYRNFLKSDYGKEIYGGSLLTSKRDKLDFKKDNEVKDWFSKNRPTVVIIAAAKVGGIHANESQAADFLLENLRIQNNLIETSWKSGVRRLLFLGSSCIYPKYAEQPIREELLLTGELEKTNEAYAIAKIAGLKLCESLRNQYGFDAISLMPTNLYGPNDSYHPSFSHVMAALIKKFADAKFLCHKSVNCWGTGRPKREFMHVDDLSKAVLFALEKFDPFSEDTPRDEEGRKLTYLNVGTGIDISIKNLAQLIASKIDYGGEILWDTTKPDGTPRKLLNIERISEMGWKPTISLEDGIKDTLKEYIKLSNYKT